MSENMQVSPSDFKKKTGRKPVADKKIPITIYRPKSEVEKLGGLSSSRKTINQFINTLIKTN